MKIVAQHLLSLSKEQERPPSKASTEQRQRRRQPQHRHSQVRKSYVRARFALTRLGEKVGKGQVKFAFTKGQTNAFAFAAIDSKPDDTFVATTNRKRER